jgi:hypothetical protein
MKIHSVSPLRPSTQSRLHLVQVGAAAGLWQLYARTESGDTDEVSLTTPFGSGHSHHIRSFSSHGHLSAAKGSSSTSHARNPFNLNFLIRLSGLMVRRWRLIGYFPILYNPFGRRGLRVAEQGHSAPLDHGAGSTCRSLFALALMLPPKLSSHTLTGRRRRPRLRQLGGGLGDGALGVGRLG